MKITLDKSVDAAYLYLKNSITDGEVNMTYPCNPLEIKGEINLDFDEKNRLIGIEVLNASKHLPKEVLEKAEIIG